MWEVLGFIGFWSLVLYGVTWTPSEEQVKERVESHPQFIPPK